MADQIKIADEISLLQINPTAYFSMQNHYGKMNEMMGTLVWWKLCTLAVMPMCKMRSCLTLFC
jgi:hypothetical protein